LRRGSLFYREAVDFIMAMYYDLPVYRDTYKLILKIFEVTKDFPREYKFTLGQDMKRDALQLVRSIYRANKSTHKKEHLETFLDEFEILKLEIRLCTDMKVLPYKKQAGLSLLMDSIGKLTPDVNSGHERFFMLQPVLHRTAVHS
jgi:hypothetical protein